MSGGRREGFTIAAMNIKIISWNVKGLNGKGREEGKGFS